MLVLSALLWAVPASAAPAPQALAPLDAASERIRTSSRELDGHVRRLGDLTADYAGEDPPSEALRATLRGAVKAEADRLHDLLGDYWRIDDEFRMAHGAALLSEMIAGGVRHENTRAVIDTTAPMDFDESAKRLVSGARLALDREESAFKKAGLRRGLVRSRRLRDAAWAAVASGLATALVLGRRRGG